MGCSFLRKTVLRLFKIQTPGAIVIDMNQAIFRKKRVHFIEEIVELLQ